jgi:DNA invertase Pin-like site-specific DNA recombinase
MSEKIQPIHTEREAYVYVRQSSMQQVRTRLESQRRQYDLRERAHMLGFLRVTVIDEDLGRSGTGSVERPGFGRLLTAVCSGRVGAVLALEASRLARNNRDWHHLIDLCAMAGTLVIDHDGVYDPGLLNDRLLLGLKGTMSEFEMSLLRQRAMEAHRDKVRRGLVLTQVPAGYIRTENEGIEKTPDRQIQEAITGIFRKFRELGSIRQVMLWYREEKLLIPVLSRESGNRKVIWSEPIYPTITGFLKNPTYAGVFVWGRKQTRTTIVEGRAHKTRGHARPQEKWEVVIPDHHEGYITWEEFMRNQEHIRSNAGWNARMGQTPGAARNGPALLAGLLRCGRCGRSLQVSYTNSKLHGPLPRYWCSGDRGRQMVRTCITFAGTRVDLVCEDSAIVSILNRLGYRTGIGNTWTEKRVQHVRHTKGFPACPPPELRRWITMQQAAAMLKVSDAVVRRLVAQKTLPAKQIVKYAPWMIEREHLDLPAVHRAVRLVHTGRRAPSCVSSDAQTRMFTDSSEV